MANFIWGSETNYPAGANPWNGQPLKVAPAGDYWLPGVPIAAEQLNYCLNQVSQNLTSAVTSFAALRALAVPTGSGSVLCTPESTGQTISGIGSGIGGLYYYDAAYTGPDNSSTSIKPTSVGAGAGAWRLQGGMLMVVADTGLTAGYGVSLTDSSGVTQFMNGGSPISTDITYVTGTSAGNMFLGDIIDIAAQVDLELNAIGTSTTMDVSCFYTINGTTPIGTAVEFACFITTGGGHGAKASQELKLRYVVTSGDISAGTLTFSVYANPLGVGGSNTIIGNIGRLSATLRRF